MVSAHDDDGGWLARLGEVLVARKPAPWHRKPVPLVLLVAFVGLFAGCTSPDAGATLTEPLAAAGEAPAEGPVAVIEVEATSAMPEEPIRFDGSDSEGAIAVWSWSFGDDATSIETDPIVEHAYDAPGEYVVVLLVRDEEGREDYDVNRVTVVAAEGAEAAPPSTPDAAAPPDPVYVWEAPKYSDAFEAISVSTVPAKDTPYAAGLGGTWVHIDFSPDDGGMLLDGLVIYQDYTGHEVCADRNAKVSDWTYETAGHYFGHGEECGARVGVATQVYVGVCVEFDGVLVPEEQWVEEDGVIFGDKMDDCWTRIVKIPAG